MNLDDLTSRLDNQNNNAPAVTINSKDNKKNSQYWIYPAFISNLELLKSHEITGVTYFFEMGSPMDDIKNKMEKTGRNEEYNAVLNFRNDIRLDIYETMKELEPGEWKVIIPSTNCDPQDGDMCFFLKRLDPNTGVVDIEKMTKTRTRARMTF